MPRNGINAQSNLPSIKTTVKKGPAQNRYANKSKEPPMLDGINISEPNYLQRTFMNSTVSTDMQQESHADMT